MYQRYINDDWWQAWAEQSAFYYICGLYRHSEIPFTELPNFGFCSVERPENKYKIDDLLENIEIKDVHFNVT